MDSITGGITDGVDIISVKSISIKTITVNEFLHSAGYSRSWIDEMDMSLRTEIRCCFLELRKEKRIMGTPKYY